MLSKWNRCIRIGLPTAAILALGAGLAAYRESWLPLVRDPLAQIRDRVPGLASSRGHDHDGNDHDDGDDDAEHGHHHSHDADHEDDHGHAGDHIEISQQARKNIGLRVAKLEPTTFTRTVTLPGMVIEKPGRSDMQVTAPLAGVVTRIYPLKGETVEAGQPLFDLRLTHEEVVQAQSELLKTTEELDVVRREIERLEGITSGVIPQKNVLDRKYEQQKLEAAQRAQVQTLLLHGLTEEQVETIRQTRRLLKVFTIYVPGKAEGAEAPHCFELEELSVGQGQHLQVGQALCVLGDHVSLYIEGRAFEREAESLSRVMQEHWAVTAAFDRSADKGQLRGELHVTFVSNKVDPESRTFRFYVELPNEVTRDVASPQGHRFIEWRFKPGQRVQLHVPLEHWPDRLVVPIDALVQEGPETFVFVQEGNRFERRPVHVEFRDRRSAVLAQDGGVEPGDTIAISGAYQLQIAMKNKVGGAVDQHAGHNH